MCGCLFNYISLILLLHSFSYIYHQCEYINPVSVKDKHNVSLEIIGKSKTDALEDLTTKVSVFSIVVIIIPF